MKSSNKHKKEFGAGVLKDLDECVAEFAKALGQHDEGVQKCADTLWRAVNLVGEKEAFEVFDQRFHLGQYNLKLLSDIGSQKVDGRVWSLPKYMHGIRYLPLPDQWQILNSKAVSVYKFASEKPAVVDLGSVNQSDWRVAFDREKNRIRTSDEQLKWIHAKKKEYKSRVNYHPGKNGLVVTNSCTISKKKLLEILDLLP